MRLTKKLHALACLAVAAMAAATAADNGQSNLVPQATDSTRSTGEPVKVHAILIVASDDGSTDSELARYEANLRRVLRFKAYRRIGEGRRTLEVGDDVSVPLGSGHRIEVGIKSAWSNQVMAGFRWWSGNLTLANTTMMRPRKSYSVLAGPATADGKGHYAVIVEMD